MKAVLCPVCTGSGIVVKGFYDRTSDTWTSCGGTEMCRSCGGTGFVVIAGHDEEKPDPSIQAPEFVLRSEGGGFLGKDK